MGANSFRSKKIVESLGEINNQILYISKAISKSYEVIFSDNGIGLSPKISDIDRIFEFGVTTTSGAGLGLYYVKQYIEQLNRAVLVKPNKIRGLSFILSWNK